MSNLAVFSGGVERRGILVFLVQLHIVYELLVLRTSMGFIERCADVFYALYMVSSVFTSQTCATDSAVNPRGAVRR